MGSFTPEMKSEASEASVLVWHKRSRTVCAKVLETERAREREKVQVKGEIEMERKKKKL